MVETTLAAVVSSAPVKFEDAGSGSIGGPEGTSCRRDPADPNSYSMELAAGAEVMAAGGFEDGSGCTAASEEGSDFG